MKLYLNETPRSFLLVSNGYALIIRHPSPTYKHHHHYLHHRNGNPNKDSASSNKVIVEFVRLELLNLSSYKDITPRKSRSNKQLLGFIGFLNVKSNIYLGFITSSTTAASPTLDHKINQITGVDFYCLNNDEFDHLINDNQLQLHQQSQQPQQQLNNVEERITSEYPAASVRKFLSLGCFYYSTEFDITSNVQERGFLHDSLKFKLIADSSYFTRFTWNSFMISELMEFRNRLSIFEQNVFDNTGFLTIITRGYAQTVNTKVRGDEDALLTLISKQSCIKNGPLFGDWGCDDNGAVSNYVETEVIIYTEKFVFAYVIVRGNVPLYWELDNSQKKLLSKNKKITYPRSFEASQHAFTRHFDRLVNQFSEVHVINALSEDFKSYKGQLNDSYRQHIKHFNEHTDERVTGTSYTINSTNLPISTSLMKKVGYNSSNPYEIVPVLVDPIINFGALFYDINKKHYTGKQLGVFRVNSFDGLNKANFISKIISQEVIELAFRDIGIQVDPDLYIKHAKLWQENEEHINKITLNFLTYSSKLQASSAASTKNSVKSHFTKKYLSGVVDPKANETAMLKLLGRLQDQVSVTLHNPIHDYVIKELNKRSKEYSSFKNIKLFASTFNVNGTCHEEDVKEWLFPSKHNIQTSYDIVFIGFQEIVELTAGQMVNTDTVNRLFWEKKIKLTLDQHNPEKFKYVSLWTGQIGGIALLLFIKEKELKNISNVEGNYKKTGLGGYSANKGGVAVSFSYANTDICLVSSHLAAGLSNVEERHQNYKTLVKGIKFSKNRNIKDHDAVIWLGDFNFRIGLPNEQVKPLIDLKNFNKLFEYDQLNKQMANGETFPFFDEMEIKFPPTYKYDNGTKVYDTSEKQRIPAWTDRILNMSRKKIIKQEVYDCCEDIIFSDHRPVIAIYQLSVNVINENIRKNLALDLYENYRKSMGDINDLFLTNNDVSFLINDIDDQALPPPSSDVHKWWLEGGKPAKIQIGALSNKEEGDLEKIINPRLPNNPFETTEEPEFITRGQLMNLLNN